MLGYRAAIFIFAIVVASSTLLVSSSTDILCGNGAVCSASETCVSHVKNSGHKYACSPFSNAVVCGDSRFSCPQNTVCNYADHSCTSSKGSSTPLVTNKNSHVKAGAIQHASNGEGLCAYLSDITPSFCKCAQDKTGTQAQITCAVSFLDLDTIGFIATLLPCINPASVSLEVTEADYKIDYLVGNFSAGVNEDIPIPGLSLDIPFVGSVGVNAIVQVDGDASEFDFNLGLDGCMSVLGKTVCGSELTSYLPIWVLNGTITLSDLCSSTASNVAH